MTGELDEESYRALAGFRYELRRFLHFSENAARGAGLTPQQHQALLAIRAHDAADRRQVRLRLTAHAAEILTSLSVAHRAELQRSGPMLQGLLEKL